MIDGINSEHEAKQKSFLAHTRLHVSKVAPVLLINLSSLQAELPLEIEYLYP